MKRLGLLVLVVVFSGCRAAPMRYISSTNPQTSIEVMTEFDGIRLYRIDVGNRSVYVAVHLKDLSTHWEEQNGKITRPVEVQTLNR